MVFSAILVSDTFIVEKSWAWKVPLIFKNSPFSPFLNRVWALSTHLFQWLVRPRPIGLEFWALTWPSKAHKSKIARNECEHWTKNRSSRAGSSIRAMKAFSRRVWLNKLPPRRCVRIYYTYEFVAAGIRQTHQSCLRGHIHAPNDIYDVLVQISPSLSLSLFRRLSAPIFPAAPFAYVCILVGLRRSVLNESMWVWVRVACAESADTKLKHLIFTHLLEKHLCKISIYNTHDGIDHREVPPSTRSRMWSILRNIFGCARTQSGSTRRARARASLHFWWRNQSDLLIWVVVGARGSRPFFPSLFIA